MERLLKGTYRLVRPMKARAKRTKKKTSEDFESKALKKLGGSIAFVSKSKLLWNGEDEKKVN